VKPRAAGAFLLLAAAAAVPFVRETGILAAAACAALLVRLLAAGWSGTVKLAVPILLFAAVLAALQVMAGTFTPALALRTVTIFLLSTAAAAVFPWRAAASRAHPRSRLFPAALFLLSLRHFALVLGAEARRMFAARRLAVPRRYGPGWFRSLAWALAAVFRLSLVRAERFYAGLLLRGYAE
jgi:hypothetical protein